jgi:DNA-binding PadR family transcriptional regulator
VNRRFGRPELKHANHEVRDDIGPANGYVLMQALGDRVGSTWKPSPGAIYPALLALEELGLVEGTDDGSGRVYELGARGRLDAARHRGTVDRVAQRASARPQQVTLGSLLDEFAASHPQRREPLDDERTRRATEILARATTDLDEVITTTRGTT